MPQTIAPQEISPSSTDQQVGDKISQFVFIDTDGSRAVDVGAMTKYLADQFSYLTASGASPDQKYQAAYGIALTYASSIAAIKQSPDAPAGGVDSASVTKDTLVALHDEMSQRARDITTQYRAFYSGLPARIRIIFSDLVAPSFPAGEQATESTRGYIETFVTDRGEESAPSPISALLTVQDNDTVRVTGAVAPLGKFITKRRLYRSATGASQSAFRLQGEYDATQTQMIDTKLDAELNDVCATFGWIEPPAGLRGLTGMANGLMLGFVGRTIYACEPYSGYAWPAKYDKPLPHEIVSIVSLGQSAFIGTNEYPYLVSGSDSASLTEERIPDLMPCASARSMVAIAGSVFYATPDGLALYEGGRVSIVSDGMDRATWSRYNPTSMHAAGYDSRYIVFFVKTDGTRGALVFDYKSRTISELTQGADAALAANDGVFILDGSTIYNLMPAGQAPRRGLWASKIFRLPKPAAFAWLQVDADFNAGDVVLRIYADGLLHYTATVKDGRPLRCPAGLRSDWRIEVESNSTINGVLLASTTEELKAIQ